MLKNPKILILDEATASLDVATEQAVMPAIFDFMKGKTTLLVTHRPELLRHADMVVRIRGGVTVREEPSAAGAVTGAANKATFAAVSE